MTAPSIWSTPSSVPATDGDGSSGIHVISYANGYWFSLTIDANKSTGSRVHLRYASNPAGTWTEATLPAGPTSYDGFGERLESWSHGVVYGAGYWAFVNNYYNSPQTALKTMLVYCTDPAGTWSNGEVSAGTTWQGNDLVYGASKFVVAGQSLTVATPFIAYADDPVSAWTFNTSTAATGYDASAKTWRINTLDYDGSTWMTIARNTTDSVAGSRYSTDITGSWGTATFPTALTGQYLLRHTNGYWTVNNTTSNYYYSDSPAGSWGTVTSADTGATYEAWSLSYGDGAWVAAGVTRPGSYRLPFISYLESTGSPAGSYTVATSTFGTPAFTDVRAFTSDYGNGYFVAGAAGPDNEIRYYATATGPTYLRQRQSPVRAPSRVSWKVY